MKAPISFQQDLRLGAQILDAWRQVSALKIKAFAPCSVVVCGMGGSTLGAHVLQTAFRDKLSVPMEIVNDYTLPAYVGKDTLVILSSYSGTTEETLAAAKEAKLRKAKIIVITAGGALLNLAKKNRWPTFVIDPVENPSGQPRMAVGYMTLGLAGMLSKIGVLDFPENDIHDLAKTVDGVDSKQAAALADHLRDSMVLLVSSGHLAGAAHVFNNQLNETGKHLAVAQIIPELDHHFLESLSFPQRARRSCVALLFQSKRYHPRVQKRIRLTAELFDKNGLRPVIVDVSGKNTWHEAWTVIALGAHTSLDLASIHRIDPNPVPNVTELKRLMAKP